MRVTSAAVLLALVASSVHAGPSRFDHVVIVVQENRTPDNLFQGLCTPPFGTAASCSTTPGPQQYDIQTSAWRDHTAPGGTVEPRKVDLVDRYDPDHTHGAFLAQCRMSAHGCAMDGAAHVRCAGRCPQQPSLRYVLNRDGILDPYLELATRYGWANAMFQTNQGPSFPAHQFLFGGTSAPSAFDDAAGLFAGENMTYADPDARGRRAGCLALSTTSVEETSPAGERRSIYPCFEHATLPDLLPRPLTWRYYAPGPGTIWTAPNAIAHLCESSGPGGVCTGRDWTDNVDVVPADVLRDIANCDLRSVSWVVPSCQNSDHARCTDGGGPSWVASIVNAIGESDRCDGGGYWRNTAIVITWDDWGGWYDHVAPTILPPPQGDYQYGFRVPLLFVSAYTATRTIDNTRLDFGSILRFVEENFDLTPGGLTFADARAGSDLSGLYDLAAEARPFERVVAPRGASFFLEDRRPLLDPDDD
jgi:phospholipase C